MANLHRRDILKLGGAVVLGGWSALAEEEKPARGLVVGQPEGAQAGLEALEAGGNAVDAAVTAALVAGVVAVPLCGIGGYGGHMVIASADGKKITAIDFNSTAPAAARDDMFPLDKKGAVKGGVNVHGWLAAGVPGTLAGLQLALDRYGTLPFAKAVQPAIRHAKEGCLIRPDFAKQIQTAAKRLAKDPACARLLFEKGQPLEAKSTFRNPELATMLEKLAKRKSVESFYRGDVAKQIAAAFKKNGGLVTAEDLAAYQAEEVKPLTLDWRGHTLHTAPLTAGGLTVLEALAILQALGWEKRPLDDPKTIHAQLEALRLAWDDRLRLLGDPKKEKIPVEELLSAKHAAKSAKKVDAAVKEQKPAPVATDGCPADGTVHISAVDAQGMMVALTLTHGGLFGAQVGVDELGLILGHGMSRFDPRPGRPNSPGPGKRPLHNMCPTIVTRDGRPVLTIGATGGRRIPNGVFQGLAHHIGRGAALADAVAAPRLHTEAGLEVTQEENARAEDADYLKKLGYKVVKGKVATLHAIARDPKTGAVTTAAR